MNLDKKRLFELRRKQRENIKMPPVSILSNTCLGGRLYHDYNEKFLSPTIDCYIPPESFIKLCCDLNGYMNEKIILQDNEIVAKGFIPTRLGDVAIYFTHSNSSFEKAVYNWEKRKNSI